ncbi:hypothetical protein CCACVL1_15677 [Corchorus capsularis]|uniref:Uncharacterized protein n=1 Tax=Corchorus capsularis TaxID=210143 RepID=A0A1R3I1G7_COCAP|nr:hypothetical protein CCACVL1_15677 [Corchorus capsularis]
MADRLGAQAQEIDDREKQIISEKETIEGNF